MAHVTKHYISRANRGLTPLVSVSKAIKKANRREKDVAKSLIASSDYKKENLKDRKLVKKWQIEHMMTIIAENIYRRYQGKIKWAKVVQSVKTDCPLSEKLPETKRDFNLSYDEYRVVKIKTKDIEKFTKFLTSTH